MRAAGGTYWDNAGGRDHAAGQGEAGGALGQEVGVGGETGTSRTRGRAV